MTEIIDRSYNKDTGELEQFTVVAGDGQPSLVKANTKNVLLYDPEDKLPFDGGLYEFMNGDVALVFSEDPETVVAPTGDEYCYIVRVDGRTVETTPNQAEDVLRAVKAAAIDNEIQPLLDVHHNIVKEQVRREVINALRQTFDEYERIESTESGWLVDDFYLVDWTASMYVKHDNPDEADLIRSGSQVVEADRSYEFVQLRLSRDIEPVEVRLGEEFFRLSTREMLFLAKVNWLLDRRHYHPDQPFWKFADKRAAVDWDTGEPEEGGEPDLSGFNL